MQIKMFLTRLGFNSKMIITGDVTQIDLPNSKQSGLKKAIEIVKDIEEIAVVEMHKNEVVRHPVVQKIIEAYEKKE
jgi:phosphate starvation-inducible PhoH-like protein